jgi:hypothetical protein
MFLMDRLVSRSCRSLAVMISMAGLGQGRTKDYLRGEPALLCDFPRTSRLSRSTPQSLIPPRSE